VHRHTHRVVRGSLLAVGRPDGRLNALTSAESTVCLSVNQASSIQNFGVTCESVTLGHNPFKLALSHANIVLPTLRPKFLCEAELEAMAKQSQSNQAPPQDSFKSDAVPVLRGPNLKDAAEAVFMVAEAAGPATAAEPDEGGLPEESDRNLKLQTTITRLTEQLNELKAAQEEANDSRSSSPAELSGRNSMRKKRVSDVDKRDGSPAKVRASFASAAKLATQKSRRSCEIQGKSAGAMMGMMADILNDQLRTRTEDSMHTNERRPMFDKINSLEQPYLGAWMSRHPQLRGKNTVCRGRARV